MFQQSLVALFPGGNSHDFLLLPLPLLIPSVVADDEDDKIFELNLASYYFESSLSRAFKLETRNADLDASS